MNELKEGINQIFTKYELHSSSGAVCKNSAKDDLMQLIETYTAKAIINELEEIWADTDCFELNPTAFTEITGEEMTVQERVKQLKTQLSSQLTNNKEGIENE